MPPIPRPPRWYAIPVRVPLFTFIGTLISFALSLLFGIIGTVAVSALHHAHPNMTIAYCVVALPTAIVTGSVVFVLALVMEIRNYRQSKTLAAIERLS